MREIIFSLKKPGGLTRLLYRAPLLLYRIGLGRILGKRFLRLTHTGRKSGLPRQAVLEVVRYEEATGACVVASGWGETSDWYRNIRANPDVKIQIGNKKFPAIAVRLSPEEASQELFDYARQHPPEFRYLARFMGYHLDGTGADIRALGRLVPMVMFKPVSR